MKIIDYGCGVLLYLDQEGRGNGLEVKIQTFDLIFNKGIDPHNAFKKLGYSEDKRDCKVAYEMLLILGMNYPVKLITNNPDKIEELKLAGVSVSERIDSYIIPRNQMMKQNLVSKRDELGHFLPKKIEVSNDK